ncbi:Ribonuclease H-like superfamily [Sesbania bispinosa]|nr:Ribonuclease H-like superfamily [Sesbania bispinosa]
MSNNDPIHVEGAAAVAPQSSSSTSEIWIHFKRQKKNDGNWTATCNNCGIELPGAGGAAEKDTLHLIDHFETCYFQDVGHESSSADETFGFGNSINGAEASRRRNLAAMIICHDYPISIVEHVGFKRLSSALNPLFRMDRQTVRADILKLYYDEKFKMMKLLSKNKSRIAITTDMWSSTDPDKHYMAIKAHFVDESWILQSRLLSFIYMPIPHSEDAFSDVIVQCLMDWNLNQKLSTLTVDNCGTSGDIFECVLNKISPRSLVLGGQLFHMRCCNHILNLMVEDGLSLISDTIEKVKTVCQDLFMEYKNMSKESETSSSSATAFVTDTSSVRGKEDWRSNFAKKQDLSELLHQFRKFCDDGATGKHYVGNYESAVVFI